MGRRSAALLGRGLLATVVVLMPLAGCSTMDLASKTSFGTAQPALTVLPASANYTADGALADARSHFKNNDFGYSAALYQKVVDLSPKNPEGYVGLGASYDRLGRFDLSDRVYASLYSLTGGTAQYYNNVGYSYLLRGNASAALTSFRKARKLDPGNVVVADNIQLLANAAAAGKA